MRDNDVIDENHPQWSHMEESDKNHWFSDPFLRHMLHQTRELGGAFSFGINDEYTFKNISSEGDTHNLIVCYKYIRDDREFARCLPHLEIDSRWKLVEAQQLHKIVQLFAPAIASGRPCVDTAIPGYFGEFSRIGWSAPFSRLMKFEWRSNAPFIIRCRIQIRSDQGTTELPCRLNDIYLKSSPRMIEHVFGGDHPHPENFWRRAYGMTDERMRLTLWDVFNQIATDYKAGSIPEKEGQFHASDEVPAHKIKKKDVSIDEVLAEIDKHQEENDEQADKRDD